MIIRPYRLFAADIDTHAIARRGAGVDPAVGQDRQRAYCNLRTRRNKAPRRQFRSRPEAKIRSTNDRNAVAGSGTCMSLRVAAPRCGWCQEETKTSVLGGIAEGSALDDGSREYGKPSSRPEAGLGDATPRTCRGFFCLPDAQRLRDSQ